MQNNKAGQQAAPEVFADLKKEEVQELKQNRSVPIGNDDSLQEVPVQKGWKKTPPSCSKAMYSSLGETIPDPYRPLEDLQNNDVQLWLNFQAMRIDNYLKNDARYAEIKERLQKYHFVCEDESDFSSRMKGISFSRHSTVSLRLGDDVYQLREDEGIRKLFRCNRTSGEKDVVMSESDYPYGEIDFLAISPDSKYIYCEFSNVVHHTIRRIIESETGEVFRSDMNGLSSFICWHPSSAGFYYRCSDKNRGYFYHDLNISWQDNRCILHASYPEAEADNESTHVWFHNNYIAGGSLAVNVRHQSKYKISDRDYIVNPEDPVELFRIPKIKGMISAQYRIFAIYDGYLYAAVAQGFRCYNILCLPLWADDWDKASVILKDIEMESRDDIVFYKGKILTIEHEDLQCVLRVYSTAGEKIFDYKPEIPRAIRLHSHVDQHGLVEIFMEGFFSPGKIFSFNLKDFSFTFLHEIQFPINADKFVASRHYALSKDGTQIPMTILHRRDIALDSNQPTILWAYGGFGACQRPQYNTNNLWWLEQGGVYAIAHLRGDGGWTKGWPHAGARKNKHNTFDDLVACAEYLIECKITSPQRLVSMGASNGGLTVTAAMQKRPDLFAGVIAKVPVLDMLDVTMGNFHDDTSLWVDEYGSLDNFPDFQTRLSYSPLHNIKDNDSHPLMLIMTVGEDRTVHPGHALKFVATMCDRVGPESALLYFKQKGDHGDLFRENYEMDFDALAAMFYFVEKVTKHKG